MVRQRLATAVSKIARSVRWRHVMRRQPTSDTYGVTVSDAVALVPPPVAVKFAEVVAFTAAVVIVNCVDREPAGTVTLASIVTPALLLDSVTTSPVDGATPV